MARIPAYDIVYQSIKARIKDGRYPKGSLLPTESKLEREFSVSRTTIRKATSMLTAEGYIDVVQGKGSEVLSPFSVQELNGVSSITETLIKRGYKVSTRSMRIEKVYAPGFVQAATEAPENTLIYRVERIQCVDGKPFTLMHNYIRTDVAPDLERYEGKFVSLYNFLENEYGVMIKDAKEYLTAKVADQTESRLLEVPVGTALLCSRRITNGKNGFIEYGVSKILAEKYEYCVYLNGRACGLQADQCNMTEYDDNGGIRQ